jgi:enterochelin esterase family protein
MAAIPSVPFVEQDTIAYFFYRGNASSVTVPGDANEWDIYSYSMTPLSTTNLWYYCAILPPDARLEYKFYADGVWLLDPLNSKQWNGPYGPNSELRMPKYVPPAETEYDASIPHGTFQDTTFYSAILGNSRTVRVYIPPGYSSTANDTFAVVVFHDGQDYITQGSANNVLDYLTAQKLIRPTIGIFVPPVIRDSEYVGNLQDQYAAFIATELMPWVDSHYRTSKNPLNRATVGISNGGNISLWICYKYPESFGNAGSFSGNILSTTNTAYATSQKMPTRLYVDVGMYESYIRSVSSAFVQVIAGRGYTRRYREWHEGHSWGNWRAHLDNALRFFDNPALSVEQRPGLPPTSYQLLQNYPNPFNPSTTISFDVPKASYVTLRVFNLLGQEVATVVSENLQPGAYRYRFDAGRLASGVYIYRLNAGGYVQTKKMTLMK